MCIDFKTAFIFLSANEKLIQRWVTHQNSNFQRTFYPNENWAPPSWSYSAAWWCMCDARELISTLLVNKNGCTGAVLLWAECVESQASKMTMTDMKDKFKLVHPAVAVSDFRETARECICCLKVPEKENSSRNFLHFSFSGFMLVHPSLSFSWCRQVFKVLVLSFSYLD